MSEKADFQVAFVSEPDDETTIVTSIEDIEAEIMASALRTYDPSSRQYSTYIPDAVNDDTVTPEFIDELVKGINTDLKQVQTANAIVKRYILTDDIIGKTYESLETNVNTQIRLTFPQLTETKKKQKTLEKAKIVISDFNNQINLDKLIRDSVPMTYANGNRILCLRYDGVSYTVDTYPIGLAEISTYEDRGNPLILINIAELKNKLSKSYKKTKKNKPLFFGNIDEEIKANFPEEVYDAFKSNEEYAVLNEMYTGTIRINNLGLQYGVSPIVRAIKPSLILSNIEKTDYVNNKAKAKKIIHQVMRKETLGQNMEKKGIAETVKAHNDLMAAWKNKTVVYTSIPQVEKIVYVEPKVDDSAPEKVNIYRSKVMTTLGIGFADSNVANFSVANISLAQLMKVVNTISSQLERILERWYKIVLKNNGIEEDYAPSIKIIDSEQMDFDMKKDIASFLYSTLNCSLSTSLSILGYDVDDERLKREKENEEGYEQIFVPRATSNTTSGSPGRPEGEGGDGNKKALDNQYNKTARK